MTDNSLIPSMNKTPKNTNTIVRVLHEIRLGTEHQSGLINCWKNVQENIDFAQICKRKIHQMGHRSYAQTFMFVRSIDLLKEYVGRYRSLRIAISVIDTHGLPVIGAIVEVSVRGSDSTYLHLHSTTDHNGIALFHFYDVKPGVWTVVVNDLHHPMYKVNSHSLHIHQRTTTV